MENHPIPQDVTGFQFRLIGDITIKQFAYLAAGAVLSWFTFILPLPFLLKFPFISFFAGSAIAFAFLPIEGRPLDVMLANFFSALFSPNQFVYQKVGVNIDMPDIKLSKQTPQNSTQLEYQSQNSQAVLNSYLINLKSMSKNPLDQKEIQYVSSLFDAKAKPQSGFHLSLPFHQTPPIQAPPEKQPTPQSPPPQNEQPQVASQTPLATVQPAPQPETPAPKLGRPPLPKAHLPFMADVPNLIAGIVRDPRGNVLANILVEIKDQEENPVRAFKTNQLGHFASATPLLNGSYTITFEDPSARQQFSAIQITTNGSLLPPLEVFSNDEREDLHKQLFGG